MKLPSSLSSSVAVAKHILSNAPQSRLDDVAFASWLLVEGATAIAAKACINDAAEDIRRVTRQATPTVVYTGLEDDIKRLTTSAGPDTAVGHALKPAKAGDVFGVDITPTVTKPANPTLAPTPTVILPTSPSPSAPEPEEQRENKNVVESFSRQAADDGLPPTVYTLSGEPDIITTATELDLAAKTKLAPKPPDAYRFNLDFEPAPELGADANHTLARNPPGAAPVAPPALRLPQVEAQPLAVLCGLIKSYPAREAEEDIDRYQKRLSYAMTMHTQVLPIMDKATGEVKPTQISQPQFTSFPSKLASVMISRLGLNSPWFNAFDRNSKPELIVGVNTLLPDIIIANNVTIRAAAERQEIAADANMALLGFARYTFEFANSPQQRPVSIEAFIAIREDANLEAGSLRLKDFKLNAKLLTPTVFGRGMLVTNIDKAWFEATSRGLATLSIITELRNVEPEVIIVAEADDSEY